jgi:hypothetical protein
MANKKMPKLIVDDEEDFIEEPHFDREDMTASQAILNFGLIFFAIASLVAVVVYLIVDQDVLYYLANLSYTNPLFAFTIIYMVLKSMLTNLFAVMIATPYTFKNKTLYEGDEDIFTDKLIILFIIFSVLMGLADYFLYHSIMHAILFTTANLSTMYVILPSLVKDIRRLYIY